MEQDLLGSRLQAEVKVAREEGVGEREGQEEEEQNRERDGHTQWAGTQ